MAAHLEHGPKGSPGPQVTPPAAILDHQLLCLIGKGSYGEIWLARNTLGAYRAVKIVFQSTFRDKRPFERELSGVQKFEPVSRLHEGLVDILQVGRHSEAGYFYCVMELADDVASGQAIDPNQYTPWTLAHKIAKYKQVPIEKCLQVGITICSALAFLHSRGLIHRDVKPSNIVFVQGTPKLADIGLVVEMAEARSYVGTEGFIPPEGPGTVQADLYSLGKVLYEMSTGKDRHEYPELPTLLDETAPSRQLLGLNKVILKACRTDPRERYRSAAEMLADLQALQQGEPLPTESRGSRRLHRGIVIGSAILGLALLVALLGRHHKPGLALMVGDKGPDPAPQGLVSWWRADGDTRDAVGANAGVFLNGPSFAPGMVGQAFSFNGTNQSVMVSNSPSLNFTNAISIAAWVYPVGLPSSVPGAGKDGMQLVGKDGSVSNRQYLLTIDAAQVFSAHVGVPNKGFIQLYGHTAVQSNTWYHAVMIYDGAALKLYVNGAFDIRKAVSGPIATSDEPLRIGGGAPDGLPPFHFAGRIDEVRLYNRALSEEEIQALYESGSAKN